MRYFKMMHKKIFISFLIMIFAILISGCELTTRPESTEPEDADAEVAMDNFLANIAKCNYSIETKDYAKISVISPKQVSVDYRFNHYQDFAILTLDNETFRVNAEGIKIDSVYYYGEGDAIDIVGDSTLHSLLDYEVTGGNIWNLFYNMPDNLLQFVSYSEEVKQLLVKIAGIGPMLVNRMQEIYLTLNKENPTEAHLTMSFKEGFTPLEDIDVLIKFGRASLDWRFKEWLNDEDRLVPEAITSWDGNHEAVLETVFFRGYGLKAVPFTTFATFSFTMDFENFIYSEQVVIRDSKATEDAMNQYIAELIAAGFEAKEIGGKTCYLLPLREEAHCYSLISLEYNDGVDMIAEKYYDAPKYDSLDEANSLVVSKGFIALPTTNELSFLTAVDQKDAETEGFFYLFDYDLVLAEYYEYENETAVQEYLDAYIEQLLEAGFNEVFDTFDQGSGVSYYQLKLANSTISFRYHFNGDGTIVILFKSEKFIEASEVNSFLESYHYPTITSGQIYNSRDITTFNYYEFGYEYKKVLNVAVAFDSEEEAVSFLDQYADLALQTFDISSHAATGIDRQFVVYNEELNIAFGFTYYPNDLYVNFEFLVY